MLKFINDLWWQPRDLVSDGIDKTLNHINQIIPLKINSYTTDKKCWTWTVPKKWELNYGQIKDSKGNIIIDTKDHPLHVKSYSIPVNKKINKKELMKHISTHKYRGGAIPYEFKYYRDDWGFCMQRNRLGELDDEQYKVVIDSVFSDGFLRVGEYDIKGKVDDTILLSAHICHPYQAEDGLSAVSVLLEIAKELNDRENHYSYKFLFMPESIGSYAYFSNNTGKVKNIKYGIVLDALGNSNPLALQLSRQGNTMVDRVAYYVMKKLNPNLEVRKFRAVFRNDERIINGPGVNIPTVAINRGMFNEWHTSHDTPDIISIEQLTKAKDVVSQIVDILDKDYIPKRLFNGEVFLSEYDLWVDWRENYALNEATGQMMLMMEGDMSVFDIAYRLNLDFYQVYDYINKFHKNKLIEKGGE